MWPRPETCVLRSRKDSRNPAGGREPDGVGRGHSASLGCGPRGRQEGPEARPKLPCPSPQAPATSGADLNSFAPSGEPVADAAGGEPTAVPSCTVVRGPSTAAGCTSVPARPLSQTSFVSTKFSHRNIFRKDFPVH